jgi:hypothetical protein
MIIERGTLMIIVFPVLEKEEPSDDKCVPRMGEKETQVVGKDFSPADY